MEASDAAPFEVLSDPTRVRILEELAEYARQAESEPVLRFSELRERVGRRDSGNFSYHLDELVGRFVRRTDEGYRLTPAGFRVVAAVRSGVLADREDAGPVPIDGTCGRCDEALSARYEEGMFRIECERGHERGTPLAPSAVRERSLSEAAAVVGRETAAHVRLAREGCCPFCYGAISWHVDGPTDLEHACSARCGDCGIRLTVPVGALVADHPAVVALYHDHGIDVTDRPFWELPFCSDDAVERVADDPATFRVTVRVEDDRRRLLVEADGSVRVEGETG